MEPRRLQSVAVQRFAILPRVKKSKIICVRAILLRGPCRVRSLFDPAFKRSLMRFSMLAMKYSLLAAVFLLLPALNSLSFAAPRCKEWKRQPNGSEARSCVGDLGKSYCESCTASGCSQAKCPDTEDSHPPSFYNPRPVQQPSPPPEVPRSQPPSSSQSPLTSPIR